MESRRMSVSLAAAALLVAACSRQPAPVTQASPQPAAEAPAMGPGPAGPSPSEAPPPSREEMVGREVRGEAPSTPAPAARRAPVERIFFDFDRDEIRSDQRQALEQVADWMRQNPSVRVVIEGHCDERGADEYNLVLGLRRASSAKRFLTAYGIDASRIETISYGEERPLIDGHDESAWSQNRRAEFTIRQQ